MLNHETETICSRRIKNTVRPLMKMVAVIATTSVHVADAVIMLKGAAYENSHFK